VVFALCLGALAGSAPAGAQAPACRPPADPNRPASSTVQFEIGTPFTICFTPYSGPPDRTYAWDLTGDHVPEFTTTEPALTYTPTTAGPLNISVSYPTDIPIPIAGATGTIPGGFGITVTIPPDLAFGPLATLVQREGPLVVAQGSDGPNFLSIYGSPDGRPVLQGRLGDIHRGPGCSYISRESPVAMVCARDGVTGVEARLGAGRDVVSVEVTTEGPDVGTALTLAMPVRVLAEDGDDVITASAFMGRGQPVALDAGAGRDRLRIMDVEGTASGGPGDDDFLYETSRDGPGAVGDGGDGEDRLIASSSDSDGPDTLNGGPGSDFIDAGNAPSPTDRAGAADHVDCGPGNDIAITDSNDHVTGCETVLRPANGRATGLAAGLFAATRQTSRLGAAGLAAGRVVKTQLFAPAGSRLRLTLRAGGSVVARATGGSKRPLRLAATPGGRRVLVQRHPVSGTLTLVRTGKGAARWSLDVPLA
jgi:hypothetical protein